MVGNYTTPSLYGVVGCRATPEAAERSRRYRAAARLAERTLLAQRMTAPDYNWKKPIPPRSLRATCSTAVCYV